MAIETRTLTGNIKTKDLLQCRAIIVSRKDLHRCMLFDNLWLDAKDTYN